MGCDIHWHSETKRGNAWICDQADTFTNDRDDGAEMNDFPNRGRDYWLFGLLANRVRTEWDWAFAQKGIPNDLSPEVKAVYDQWDCDAHSASWLTRAELKAKLEELKPLRAEMLISSPQAHLLDAAEHHVKRLEEILGDLTADVLDTDQRIVFWFDN